MAARRNSIYRVSTLLALLLLTSLAITPAAAQDAGAAPTLTIANEDGAPTGAFYAEIEPGGTGRIEVGLTTGADVAGPVEATAAIANVTTAPNGGLALGPAGEPLAAPATWLEFDDGPLTLEPGEPVARTIEVAVPANTEPGQYVAALALTATDPTPIPGTSDITQTARTTAAIAITVPGAFETGFELGDPTLVTNGATDTGAVGRVEIPVTNTGTVPVSPRGTLTLESDDETDAIAIPVAMGAVFAGAGTVLSVPLAAVPPGDYDVAVALADPDTNASADLDGVSVTVPEPPPGATGVAFDRIAVDVEGNPLDAVTIAVDVANIGAPIPSAALTLEASRNGLLVDEVAIAGNAPLADGVTSFATTYTPEGGYTSGLWTFRLRLESTGPTGTTTLLAQSGTIAKIDVP